MASMVDIRAGVTAALLTLQNDGVTAGETTLHYQVDGYPNDAPDLPAIFVMGLDDIDYTSNPHIHSAAELSVQAFVAGVGDERNALMLLDPLMYGPTAVKKLLEADRTLGGVVDDAFVSRMTGARTLPLANVKLFGAEWLVQLEVDD